MNLRLCERLLAVVGQELEDAIRLCSGFEIEEISRLISRADQAMYLAKSAGKDRIRESDDGESDDGE